MTYLGSKKRFTKYIVPIIQETMKANGITTFVDAMCGGCNVIEKVKADRKIAMDLNECLIELYRYALDGGEFPEKMTREDWDACKDHPETQPKWKVALVEFFCSYLARGFSGGYSSKPRKSTGKTTYEERMGTFKKQLPNLENIEFYVGDIFEEFPFHLDDKILIYLDPPYENTKKYSIAKHFDYQRFWERARELSREHMVLISSQVAPNDFKVIWELETKANLSSLNGREMIDAIERLYVYEDGIILS